MSRLPLTFACGSCEIAATFDNAPGTVGLLIVSGGNEIRSGAFSGQAKLSREVAKMGFPVFRFDRRGTGDSEGENRGFRKEAKDIAAALSAFRAIAPHISKVVGFGNCDAATALALAFGQDFDALILSNPWVIEESTDDTPPPSAIRSRYADRLKNPAEIVRLLTGKVDIRKLASGLGKAIQPKQAPSTLLQEFKDGIAAFDGDTTFLLAESDRTAQVFMDGWPTDDPRIARCAGASHAYVEPDASVWLRDQVVAVLRSQRHR